MVAAGGTARAVASAPTVAELLLPFIATGGVAILQRGTFDEPERIALADAALVLGGEVETAQPLDGVRLVAQLLHTVDDPLEDLGEAIIQLRLPRQRLVDVAPDLGVDLAAESRVAIVPTAITGSFEIMRKGSWRITPRTIHIDFLEPMEPPEVAELGAAGADPLMDAVRSRIAAAVGETQAVAA